MFFLNLPMPLNFQLTPLGSCQPLTISSSVLVIPVPTMPRPGTISVLWRSMRLLINMVAKAHGKRNSKGLVTASADPALLLLKPQTFMNLSGEAVAEAVNFHKLASKNVIVFHDDLDLQPGQVKVKQGGGTGGHNGLKSIDAHIGPDYWRVRLGIGHPGVKGDIVTQYVLSPFAKADKIWIGPLLDVLANELPLMLDGKTNEYQSRIARKMAAALKEE